jgi:hypothetical protein
MIPRLSLAVPVAPLGHRKLLDPCSHRGAVQPAVAGRPDLSITMVTHNRVGLSIRRFPSAWLALGEALGMARWRPWRRWREQEPRLARCGTPQSADRLVSGTAEPIPDGALTSEAGQAA